jgi:hypothetical protein
MLRVNPSASLNALTKFGDSQLLLAFDHVMNVDATLTWDIALGIQLFILAVTALILYKVLYGTAHAPGYRSVAILVLGDIGRSPRMMYHAQSFVEHNFQTYIIAYEGSVYVSLWL